MSRHRLASSLHIEVALMLSSYRAMVDESSFHPLLLGYLCTGALASCPNAPRDAQTLLEMLQNLVVVFYYSCVVGFITPIPGAVVLCTLDSSIRGGLAHL